MGVLDMEPGSCDGMVKGVNVGDDEFLSMIDIFDFPMESLEGADDLAAGWDATKLQSLGPIPTESLMDLPPVPQGYMGNGGPYSDALCKPNSLIVGNAKPKQLPNYGNQSSKSNIHHENAPSYPQESGVFQTHSPVSVLENRGSCPAGKILLMKPDIIIPVRPRSKRSRATVFNPWFTMAPLAYATSAYKKAAGYKRPRGRKEKVSEAPVSSTTASGTFKKGNDTSYVTVHYETHTPTKKCSHCQVTKTPQWREGPMGPKTLCNACGVRYRSKRLYPEYRPLASPTFVPALHSNSHRKVVAMRMGARNKVTVQEKDRKVMAGTRKEDLGQEKVNDTKHNTFISSEADPNLDPNASTKFMGTRMKAIKQENELIPDTPMSPAPEFVPMSSHLFDLMY